MRFIVFSVLRVVCISLCLCVALHCDSENKIDAAGQVISQYSSSFNGSGSFPVILKNNTGAIVWMEPNWSFPEWFFWSEETGVLKISEDPELKKLDAMTANRTNGNHLVSSMFPNHLDDEGNLFFKIVYKSNESKVGVWNKKHGFRFLDIRGLNQVTGLYFSGKKIIATGYGESGGLIMAVVNPTVGFWPWDSSLEEVEEPVIEPSETTPWDSQPYGKHGARLCILQQLLKQTKSPSEKKIVMTLIEGEVACVFDLLQYNVKCAQALLIKAKSEAKCDSNAEKMLADSKKHISALLSYFKMLPKASRDRIDAIHLPSKDWSPKP